MTGWVAPLPSPLPARSSRGEGTGGAVRGSRGLAVEIGLAVAPSLAREAERAGWLRGLVAECGRWA